MLHQAFQMKVSAFTLIPILLLIDSIHVSIAIECGHRLTSDCLGDSDIRYDDEYTNEILKQDSRWEKFEGFFQLSIRMYNEDGLELEAEPYNPNIDRGLPYQRSPVLAFFNHTFDGSRFIANRYYIYSKAPIASSFCSDDLKEPLQNVIGSGTCGETGLVRGSTIYGTSSYEKDGRINTFRHGGDYAFRGTSDYIDTNTSSLTNVDDSTIYGYTTAGKLFSKTNSFTFLDSDEGLVNTVEYRKHPRLPTLQEGTVVVGDFQRLSRDDWVNAIQRAYIDETILKEDQLPAPFDTVSLLPETYPTENEWCGSTGKDPVCSNSPYQEPEATVRGGVIAGFTTLICGVLAICAVYATIICHRRKLQQQQHRFKEQLVRRIAKDIAIGKSAQALTPEMLEQEFAKIDSNNDGTINKEEMEQFLNSDMMGELSHKDFESLWEALDVDGTGDVDFVEFVVFLSACGSEFDQVHAEQQHLNRDEKMQSAARRLSSKHFQGPSDDDEENPKI